MTYVHYTEMKYTKANGDVVIRRSSDDAYINRILGRMKDVEHFNTYTTWEKYHEMEKVIIIKKK